MRNGTTGARTKIHAAPGVRRSCKTCPGRLSSRASAGSLEPAPAFDLEASASPARPSKRRSTRTSWPGCTTGPSRQSCTMSPPKRSPRQLHRSSDSGKWAREMSGTARGSQSAGPRPLMPAGSFGPASAGHATSREGPARSCWVRLQHVHRTDNCVQAAYMLSQHRHRIITNEHRPDLWFLGWWHHHQRSHLELGGAC